MSRFLATLLALVLITSVTVAGVGYYRGWFNVSTATSNGETELTLTVDKNKIKEDANKAAKKGKEVVEETKKNAQQLLGREMVKGKLTTVKGNTITVTPNEGNPMTIQIEEKTTIKENDRTISLSDLTPGQPVMVVYATREDTKVAHSVTVLTK